MRTFDVTHIRKYCGDIPVNSYQSAFNHIDSRKEKRVMKTFYGENRVLYYQKSLIRVYDTGDAIDYLRDKSNDKNLDHRSSMDYKSMLENITKMVLDMQENDIILATSDEYESMYIEKESPKKNTRKGKYSKESEKNRKNARSIKRKKISFDISEYFKKDN